MRLFFLLAPILHVGAKITLLDGHKSVISVPTFDFFEYRPNSYNVTGIACRMSLIKDPETQLCKVVAPPVLKSNKFTKKLQQTIMYVHFNDAEKCGIEIVSQLFEKAYEMQPFLSKAGYPESNTLVIFTGEQYKGAIGCPIKEPYLSRKISVPDSAPPRDINVSLVGGERAIQFLEIFDDTKLYAFKVIQETDPWNALFLSFGYVLLNWCGIAIYTIAVLAALKITFETHGKGAFTMNLRTVIFWMAVLSALRNLNSNKFLVSIASRYVRHHTYFRENLEIVGGFLCAIASQAVLYLWSALLMKIRPSYSIYILRGIILFGVLSSVAVCISGFVSFNLIYTGPIMDKINETLPLIVIPAQFLLAIAFVAFSVNFHLSKKLLDDFPQAVAALTRLSLLGLVGFLGYGVAVIIGIIYIHENECEPVVMLITKIMSESSVLLCGIALLFIPESEPMDTVLK